MRVGFIIGVLAGCVGGVYLARLDIVLNQGKNLFGIAAIVTAILGPLTAGKYYQSKTELYRLKENCKEEKTIDENH